MIMTTQKTIKNDHIDKIGYKCKANKEINNKENKLHMDRL